MSIDSVISNTVNNILIGDMYLSLKNAEGEEVVQIYPERLERIYSHYWKTSCKVHVNEREEEYKDEAIEYNRRAYCRFKFNGKLTHSMRLEVLPSFAFVIYETSTLHFMPFNIEVLEGVHHHYKFVTSLSEFIEHAFPELPTSCEHDYEHMKLTDETLSVHKRKRDDVLNTHVNNNNDT